MTSTTTQTDSVAEAAAVFASGTASTAPKAPSKCALIGCNVPR